MATKTFKARIQNKHDTEANWNAAVNFKPLAGELIIYDKDNTHSTPRFKVGDGNTLVNNLPFYPSGDVTTAGNNTFTGTNTFAKRVTFAHGITNWSSMIISPTGATDPTKPAPYAIYNYGTITLKASGVTGDDKVRTLTFPTSASGTLALTSDIPVANSGTGTTALTSLKIGDTIYSIPSGGGSGDVTSSGTNIFTGDNTFKGKVIIGTEPTSGQQTPPLPYTTLLNNSISIVNDVDATIAKIEPTQFYVNMGAGESATYTGNKIIYSSGGVDLTLNFPTNSGVTSATKTLATLSDIPIKSASLDGTTLNITLA